MPSLRDATAESPAPVRAVANALSQWIGQLGAVWVEGQVTQFTRRPGLATAVPACTGFLSPSGAGQVSSK